MAGEEAVIVAGVGCRRGTSADELEKVVRLALGVHALPAERAGHEPAASILARPRPRVSGT